MKIILNGVETENKGAELMLYAILQEIERKYPEAEVFIPIQDVRQGFGYVHTSLKMKYLPFGWFVKHLHLRYIFKLLQIP